MKLNDEYLSAATLKKLESVKKVAAKHKRKLEKELEEKNLLSLTNDIMNASQFTYNTFRDLNLSESQAGDELIYITWLTDKILEHTCNPVNDNTIPDAARVATMHMYSPTMANYYFWTTGRDQMLSHLEMYPNDVKRMMCWTGVISTQSQHFTGWQQCMREMRGSNRYLMPIVIKTLGPGGEVGAGNAVYNEMKLLPCPVWTICEGSASSMMALLWIAGDRRFYMNGAEIMFHRPKTGMAAGADRAALEIAEEGMAAAENIVDNVLVRTAPSGKDIGGEWLSYIRKAIGLGKHSKTRHNTDVTLRGDAPCTLGIAREIGDEGETQAMKRQVMKPLRTEAGKSEALFRF